MANLSEGTRLRMISWLDYTSVIVGEDRVKQIVVVMEYGQMSMVPWAVVTFEDGSQLQFNLAMASEVVLDTSGK